MCGIVGVVHFEACPSAPRLVDKMADSIIHRGPDDDGSWFDSSIALGFRRLAIVDLEAGAQPMSTEDGSIQVVFNGEIYNHRSLRRDLEARGHRFVTDHSDTEVLVHGYREWGERLPEHLNGMFAFAVWDAAKRQLFMARDRLGIKPLYLAHGSYGTAFASEARALHASGLVAKEPDYAAVSEYLQQQNVWGGRSMFAGVEMLQPGTSLTISAGGTSSRTFWDIEFDRQRTGQVHSAEELQAVLDAALSRQLAADVPVMTYLSGGIDSSAIAAKAHQIDANVNSYSCLFDLTDVGEDKFVDEREYSRAVAAELGINHTELELPRDDLKRSLDVTVQALEEPRMGAAYVNYRIAERVAQDSKVVLSGCGGDEIFGGYVGRYKYVRDAVSADQPRRGMELLRSFFRQRGTEDGASILGPLRALYGFPVAEHELDTALTPDFRRLAGDYRMRDSVSHILMGCPSTDIWDQLLYVDAKTYLSGLLVVEDKLSMIHSLETRVPLLDNEVIDFAATCTWPLLTDGETGKMVFRNAIRDWVPAIVADKPKMGFGPPDASWYRGPLKAYILERLSRQRIEARGVMRPDYVQSKLSAHMDGSANNLPLIWSLLSFDAWCEAHGLFGGKLDQAI